MLFLYSVGLVIFAVYFVRSGYYDVIVSRFGDEGVSSITTGRSDIWKAYISQISTSLKTMFLGALETFKVLGGFGGYVDMSTCEIPDTLSNPTELQFPSL